MLVLCSQLSIGFSTPKTHILNSSCISCLFYPLFHHVESLAVPPTSQAFYQLKTLAIVILSAWYLLYKAVPLNHCSVFLNAIILVMPF
jgi:hypothetical protein